ncbi:MAG: PfkB family carbohydrate kinase [Anaerolineae bacterium]
MTNNNHPIISVGDLVADIITAIPVLPAVAGQHQVADEVRLEPGGGANFLIAGARLGWPMAAIGALGADEWGQRVAAALQAEGIDLSGVTLSGTTTTVIVLVSRAGEHVFLGQYGHGPTVTVGDAASRLLHRAGAVFCAGYTLLEARLVEAALDALAQAKAAGIPVYFDPGPQMAGVPPQIKARLLPLVDVVLTTVEEIPLLLVDGSTPADVLAAGVGVVVAKRGAAGCAVYAAGESAPVVDLPGHPVSVVDTSAAGDSFNAGFMVGRLRGWSLAEAARLANAVGAAKVQKLGGGRSVPTLPEVRAVIEQFGVSLPWL